MSPRRPFISGPKAEQRPLINGAKAEIHQKKSSFQNSSFNFPAFAPFLRGLCSAFDPEMKGRVGNIGGLWYQK